MKMTAATVTAVGLGLLIGAAMGGLALVDVCTWNNTSGGSWGDATNWDPQEVPDTADEAATIPDDGFGYAIDLDVDPAIAQLTHNNPLATLSLNDHVLTLYDAGASVNHGVIEANFGVAAIAGDLSNGPGGEIDVVSGQTLVWDDDDAPADGVVLVNDGTIVINSDAGDANTVLRVDTDVTLTGTGELILNADFDWAQLTTLSGVSITHEEDHLIHGQGNIRTNMLNEGAIVADAGNWLSIYPGLMRGGPREVTFTNAPGAHIRAESGTVIIRYADRFLNEGTVEVVAGQQLDVNEGDYVQTSGKTDVEGGMQVADGIFDFQGGSVRGEGNIEADVQMSGGTIFPRDIFTPGVLEINGSLDILDGSIFIDLASQKEHDQLNMTGDVQLAGNLYIYTVGGYIPPQDEQFVIITANSVGGEFDQVLGSGVFEVAYNPQDVTITVVTPPRPADINGDGVVSVLDFLDLLAHWGHCPDPCPPCYADINYDCEVNVIDFLALLANWG